MRRSQGEMYIGHTCLSVCMSVCLSMATFRHYCTDPDVTCGNGRGYPLVVHCWADLQLVHRFRCYDNIARMRNFTECLYSLCAWFLVCGVECQNVWFVGAWSVRCSAATECIRDGRISTVTQVAEVCLQCFVDTVGWASAGASSL